MYLSPPPHLSALESAQPPALKASCVLLQHRQEVPLADREFIGRLRDVVVQSPGNAVLRMDTTHVRGIRAHSENTVQQVMIRDIVGGLGGRVNRVHCKRNDRF